MKKIFLIICLIILNLLNIFSQSKDEIINKVLSEVNQNNFGTEFWISIPPALLENNYNYSNKVRFCVYPLMNGKISLNILSKTFKEEKTVEAGKLYEFTLNPEIAQIYLKDPQSKPLSSTIFSRSGIQLISDVPFSLYVIVDYISSFEGFLAYPVSRLGKNYIVSTHTDPVIYYPLYNSLPAMISLLSPFDDNEVTFTMGGENNSITSDGLTAGKKFTRTLNKGDIWLISSDGRNMGLSGSGINSTKPLSVISANQFTNIPSNYKNGNFIIEMETPTTTWSNNYLIGKIYNRKYSPIVKVFAKENNTNVFINNFPVGTINNSIGKENDAFLEIRLQDYANNGLYFISGDRPINVVVFNTGTEEDGLPTPAGGPFKIVTTPIEQFTTNTIFSVNPFINSNAGTFLGIISELNQAEQISDELKLIKYKFNFIENKKIKDLKPLYVSETIQVDKKKYIYLVFQIQSDGDYAIVSDLPFYATLYGNKSNQSYGILPSINLRNLYSADKIAPVSSYYFDCNGLIIGNTEDTADKGIQPSNLGGHIFLSNQSENIAVLEFEKIIPGITKKINWKLKVIDINKPAKGVIKFWDAASNQSDIVINYKPLDIHFETNYVNFGSLKINQSIEKQIKLINNSQQNLFIKEFSLKNGKVGFQILENSSFTIPANDYKNVKIKFNATTDGLFLDSLGFIDSCGIVYKVKLEAVVGSPIIEVSDINFGDVIIGNVTTEKSKIKNSGASDLIIKGYKLPNSAFNVNFGRDISPNNPLIIKRNESFEFYVSFAPIEEENIVDSVVFYSDAFTKDNICIINARGIQPGLVAESYNWNRKRIHRNEFPAGPFFPENDYNGILISNLSNKSIKISDIKIINRENADAFELNTIQLKSKTFTAGEKFILKVGFRPEKIGYHNLEILITDEFNNNTKSKLTGIGVVPKINNAIVDFDTVLVNTFTEPKIKDLIIKNLGYDEWEFADTVNIFDIIPIDSSISGNWSYYGKKGFKIDNSKINFPIKLAPGDFISIPIAFQPNQLGSIESKLKILSDALESPEIILKGYGTEQSLIFTDVEAETCVNSSTVVSSLIKNNGNTVISFLPPRFTEQLPEFSIINYNEFETINTLQPGEEKYLKIEYRPYNYINKSTEIILETIGNKDNSKSAKVIGKPKYYKANLFFNPIEITANVGSIIQNSIILEFNEINQNTKIKELKFIIEYNPKVLKPILEQFRDNDWLIGKFHRIIKQKSINQLEITYIALSYQGLEQNIKMLDLAFETFYPNDNINYSDLIIKLDKIDNNCILMNTVSSRVNLKEECLNHLRQFTFNNQNFYLKTGINNNSNINIDFGIGLDVFTEIIIYNYFGEEILSPIKENLKIGKYSLSIPTKNISSGIYFITIKSGPFIKTEKIILEK